MYYFLAFLDSKSITPKKIKNIHIQILPPTS